MLHVLPILGILKIAGVLLAGYSCYKLKIYDVMILLGFFISIDISFIAKNL